MVFKNSGISRYIMGIVAICFVGGFLKATTKTINVYAQPAPNQSTGIILKVGDTVDVQAPGTWSWGISCTADGTAGRPFSDELPVDCTGAYFGVLIGKISEAGSYFIIGSQKHFIAPENGELLLGMNDRQGCHSDNSGYLSVTITVTSTVPTLQSISVTPSSASITSGSTKQFTATGTYSDSSTQNITSSVTWNSSNTSVATINSSGLATGSNPGTTNITATLSGITSSSRVLTVTQASHMPVAHDVSKAGKTNEAVTFGVSDFINHFTDDPGNILVKIKITSLPNNGVLKLSKNYVVVNQEIVIGDVSQLTYVPEANWTGEDLFTWAASDGAIYSNNADVTIKISDSEASFCSNYPFVCYGIPVLTPFVVAIVGVVKYAHQNNWLCFKNSAETTSKSQRPIVIHNEPHIEIGSINVRGNRNNINLGNVDYMA